MKSSDKKDGNKILSEIPILQYSITPTPQEL
jgi:hypothetical protein